MSTDNTLEVLGQNARYRVRLEPSIHDPNPRTDQDPLGHLNIDNRHMKRIAEDPLDPENLEKEIERIEKDGGIVLPITAYIHSGVALHFGSKGPGDDIWDTSNVGYLYVTGSQLEEEYGSRISNPQTKETVLRVLESELEEFEAYTNGSIYDLVLDARVEMQQVGTPHKHYEWKEVEDERHGPFYGYDYATEGALVEIDKDIRTELGLLIANDVILEHEKPLFDQACETLTQWIASNTAENATGPAQVVLKHVQDLDKRHQEYKWSENRHELLAFAEEIKEKGENTGPDDLEYSTNPEAFKQRTAGLKKQIEAQAEKQVNDHNTLMKKNNKDEIAKLQPVREPGRQR